MEGPYPLQQKVYLVTKRRSAPPGMTSLTSFLLTKKHVGVIPLRNQRTRLGIHR